MSFLFRVFALGLSLLLVISAEARTIDNPAPEKYWEQETWLNLLHFDRKGLLGAKRSAVISRGFFFADDGTFNPESEFEATLKAMQAQDNQDGQHASCLFPARAMWLEQLGLVSLTDTIECPEWEAWRSLNIHGDVGLTFASGYLGNPASFFGHLLLHIKRPADSELQGVTSSHLLDSSLNFGADVPSSDGLVIYMLKGLFGGYEAQYSETPFYRNNSIYSESQMRDSWFYELELPQKKREFLIAHLYEILGHNFDYLFLSENCASRIGRTLELVIDEEFTEGFAPWVSPEQVIRKAAEYSKTPAYYPSRRKLTEDMYHKLTSKEQQVALDIWPALDELSMDSEKLKSLPYESRARVLDVLVSHALYVQQNDHEDVGRQLQGKLLKARLGLPVTSSPNVSDGPLAPHESLPGASIRIRSLYSSVFGNGFGISLRPLQYDLLESDEGRMPYAALEVLRVDANVFSGEIRLDELIVFNVTNLNALKTGLPSSSSLAWQAKASWGRVSLACRDCYEGNIQLSAGQSWRLGYLTSYVLVGGALRTTKYQQGAFAAAASAGTIVDWSSEQRTIVSGEYHDAAMGYLSRTWSVALEHRWKLPGNMDIRFRGIRDRTDSQVEFSIAKYW